LVPVCPDIELKVGKKREIFRIYPLLQLFVQSLCQGGAMIGIYGDSSMASSTTFGGLLIRMVKLLMLSCGRVESSSQLLRLRDS